MIQSNISSQLDSCCPLYSCLYAKVAYTPPLLLPERTIHYALLCCVVHAVRSTHVSFLPLPGKKLLTPQLTWNSASS